MILIQNRPVGTSRDGDGTYQCARTLNLAEERRRRLHSLRGDTTSSAFRKSKLIFCRLYLKSPDLKEAAAVFSDPSASQEDVHKAGITCFLKWYGAPTKETSLNA
uniref:Uncharacterized protein n=1 Tax=Cacopsylla melanoneura TaxID=428564 RepID=A0A8D8RSN3_9HEMI